MANKILSDLIVDAARTGKDPVELTTIFGLVGLTADVTELNRLDGAGTVVASGTTQAAVADVAITYTTGNPSIVPNGAVTIANGATPTVSELLELIVELKAKVELLADALTAFKITL